ncbi:ead/Ea22-like family protein [Pseudomonas putida]|nr:ead/Ea22-like family protein [Pseudomonas putida]EKT8868655.1 ead/Ea22-like family protein [Pseudomonas putida]
MTIDKAKLKVLAEAATPGRHYDRLESAGGGIKYECTGDDGSLVLKVDHKNDEFGFVGDRGEADEAFFLACSPATILALLAEIERLKERNVYWIDQANTIAVDRNSIRIERDQLKAENEDYRSGQDRYEQIIDDLKAESEELRKDAERYRAIRDEIPHADLGRAILDVQTADEYDAAVDAAMAKEASHG